MHISKKHERNLVIGLRGKHSFDATATALVERDAHIVCGGELDFLIHSLSFFVYIVPTSELMTHKPYIRSQWNFAMWHIINVDNFKQQFKKM